MPTVLEPIPLEFVSQTAFFDYKTPATQALEKINRYGAVIVTQGDEYCGVVDTRTLFREGLLSMKLAKSMPIGKFVRKLPMLVPSASVSTAISYFHEFSAKALPFGDGERVRGIVTRETLLSAIVSTHLLSKAKVSDAMSTPVIAIDIGANASQAISAMSQNRITRLVVLDGGRVAGLITQRDLFSALVTSEERLPERETRLHTASSVPIRDIVKTSVFSVDYNRPIEEAIRSLLEKRISSLMVTRGGRPVGMLSARDIFSLAAAVTEKVRSRIIITGLDDFTREYREEIEDEVNRLIDKVDRFSRFGVDYASVNVKKIKSRGYEFRARLGLQRKGAVFATATGYGLEATLTSLLNNLFKLVKEEKEVIVSDRKGGERYYEEA